MSSSPTSPGNEAPVKEGDVLASKYRVEKVLGVGGMGVVVAAEHIELSQKVALKFLLKQAAQNEDLVGRFLREARASVRLKGSHVAKTLDVGRLEDGCPYIVMEYLEGHDLHTEIRSKTELMPVDVACSYIVQAAEGLAEAHSLGIIHRDLKPGNLFLTRGVDGRPLVKVLDFGISKTMDASIGGDGLSLTKTEMLLGSPLYMSPEQMRSSKHVDERSDLWAIGAIAFELLTLKVPFEAETILELCFKVAQEKAPSPQLIRPDLPNELAAAVLRCLEKDPNDRFPNIGELMAAFEPFALLRDRGSAERALDVLGTGKRPPMRSLPAVAMGNAVTVGIPNGGVGSGSGSGSGAGAPASAATPMPVLSPPAPSSSQADAPAQAAWGTTQAQEKAAAKSRKGIVIGAAAAVAVVAIAAFAGLMVSRRGATEMMPAGVVAGSSMTPSPPPTTTSAPVPPSTGLPPTQTSAASNLTAAPEPSAVSTPSSVGTVKTGKGGAQPIGKGQKPAGSASVATPPVTPSATAAPTPPQPEQGGFIKVRE